MRSLPGLRGGADIFQVVSFDRGARGTYHARAMGNPLRDRRAPSELAASGQVIDFSEKITEFVGLAEIVKSDLEILDPAKLPPNWRDAVVAGQLSFGFADAQNGLPGVQGRLTATIDAVCQRCLEAFQLPLDVELRLLFGREESTVADADGFEIWELEEDKLRPLDLVEEALIMAMPLVAMHVDSETCHEPREIKQRPSEKLRPFAALKSQMEEDK
ncbi:MAG: DUF177 domain-containing protein [Gammaproteobacteria bacterium]|nr:DUF177 domain-containing protein [Gammaproteobacteria bacterium]